MGHQEKKRVIVIGAGPAGLTAAYKLSFNDHFQVQVLEASPHIGGLSRSFELWGQIVDLGPHRFFSNLPQVNAHWQEVVGSDYSLVDRSTRIYYRKRFFDYPLKPFNALSNLGPFDVARCLASYALARLRPFKPKTFEDWVVGRFGRRLFEIFFKTYSEKVWGIPCSKIDADWAAQRIKKLSLFEAVKAAMFKDRSRKHVTLVDQFAYPKGGTGAVYWKTAEKIIDNGGTVELKSPVEQVLVDTEPSGTQRVKGVRLRDGRTYAADYVISTMPLTLMVKSLPNTPKEVLTACEKLYYRNTILVYLEIDSKKLFPDNWIYVHSPEVRHGRITNFRNWCPSLVRGKDTSILCMEYWCFDNEEIWTTADADLGKLAQEELRKLSLIPPDAQCLNTSVVKIPRSYPVYETGYQQHLNVIQQYVDSIDNLLAIGRYGAFKYNNQDHSILMGLLAAREIESGEGQRLWSVNTDYEYQEAGKVEDMQRPQADTTGAKEAPLSH